MFGWFKSKNKKRPKVNLIYRCIGEDHITSDDIGKRAFELCNSMIQAELKNVSHRFRVQEANRNHARMVKERRRNAVIAKLNKNKDNVMKKIEVGDTVRLNYNSIYDKYRGIDLVVDRIIGHEINLATIVVCSNEVCLIRKAFKPTHETSTALPCIIVADDRSRYCIRIENGDLIIVSKDTVFEIEEVKTVPMSEIENIYGCKVNITDD